MGSETLPRLSVVMPTFNRRESLKVTLDGLARQTYPTDQWEAVVVSDGSTDGTNEFLTDYAARAPFRLRPIVQENAGPSRARNRGIREATGEVVVFIDDDVEPVPGFLAAHAAHHARSETAVVIGPMSPDPQRRNAEPSWIAWEHAMLEKQYTAFRTGEWPKDNAGPNHFYSGNASVRRAHLLTVNGFDEQFTRQEDVEMAERLKRECGVRFYVDLEATGIHRPLRTWESWLKVPYAYGKLDVVRSRRDPDSWGIIRYNYHSRNRVTRGLIDLLLSAPALSAPVRNSLRTLADTAYRAHRVGAAFALLSAIYNARYLEAARDEMNGDAAALRRVLAGETPAPAPIPEADQTVGGTGTPSTTSSHQTSNFSSE